MIEGLKEILWDGVKEGILSAANGKWEGYEAEKMCREILFNQLDTEIRRLESDRTFDQEGFRSAATGPLKNLLMGYWGIRDENEREKKKQTVIQQVITAAAVKKEESKKALTKFVEQTIELVDESRWNNLDSKEQFAVIEGVELTANRLRKMIEEGTACTMERKLPDWAGFLGRLKEDCQIQISLSDHSTFNLEQIDSGLFTELKGEEGMIAPSDNQSALLKIIEEEDCGNRRRAVVMVGEGGIGKTATMLGTSQYLLNRGKAAVFVPLRKFIPSERIEGYIENYVKTNILKDKWKDVWDELLAGSCTEIPKLYLFADGFNELKEELCSDVFKELREFSLIPGIQVIISSRRPLEARSCYNLKKRQFTMQRLAWNNVEEYLKKHNIPIPDREQMSEVLGIPLMLKLYVSIKKRETPEIMGEKYLRWKGDMSNPNHILWNYIQCQVFQAEDVSSNRKRNSGEEGTLYTLILAAEYIAPYIACKMNERGMYEADEELVSQWIENALQLLKKDIRKKEKGSIGRRLSAIERWKGAGGKRHWVEAPVMFRILTDRLNLLTGKKNADFSEQCMISFEHQDFQDILHLIYIESSIEYIGSQFFLGAFTDYEIPYDVITMMKRAFTKEQTARLWKQAKEGPGKYGIRNLTELEKRIRDSNLSEMDFSGFSLEKVNLSGTILSDGGRCASFRNARIMQDTFQKAGHSAPVTGVSWSPMGGRFASAAYDNKVCVWNAETGALIGTFFGHTHYVRCVAWSPKGSWIASGGDDRTLRIWDAEEAAEKEKEKGRVLEGHRGWIYCLAWSEDERWLVSGDSEKEIFLWDCQKDWPAQKQFSGHLGRVRCLAWKPDSDQCFASGADDRTVKIWDRESGLVKTISGLPGPVEGLEWSPNGKILAASSTGRVYCWEISGLLSKDDQVLDACEKAAWVLEEITAGAGSLAWSEQLLAVSAGRKILLWNMDELTETDRGNECCWKKGNKGCFAELTEHMGTISGICWSKQEKMLLSCSDDGSIRIWKARAPLWNTGWGCIRIFEGTSAPVRCTSWSPDGKLVAAGYDDNWIRIWGMPEGICRKILKGHSKRVKSTSWSPDGKYLASGSNDGLVLVWDAETGKRRAAMDSHKGPDNSVLWLDCETLVSGSDDKRICVWNVWSDRCRWLDGHEDSVYSISMSPGGDFLVSGSDDKTIRFWNLKTMEELQERRIPRVGEEGHTKAVRCVGWRPGNGDMVISGSNDRTVRRWRADTGEPWGVAAVLEKHEDFVYCLSWSPDGAYFVTGSTDDTLWIWEKDTGHPLQHLTEHRMFVWSVAWSPDGTYISSASSDGTLCIWDVMGLISGKKDEQAVCRIKLKALPGTDISGCDFSDAFFETDELKSTIRMNGGIV